METIEQLEKTMELTNLKLVNMRNEKFLEENQHLLGQCFRHDVQYSAGIQKYWVYRKVIRMSIESKELYMLEFDENINGKITFDVTKIWNDKKESLGQKITNELFDTEWGKILAKIASMNVVAE